MAYVKDAYKKIYQHPKWKEEARGYEMRLSVALYKNPYVNQAAHDALRRVSEVLTAYYSDKEGEGSQTNRKLDSAEELSAGVEQLSGEKSDTSIQNQAAGQAEAARDAKEQQDAKEASETAGQGPIAVNSILTRAFLHQDPQSAGQVDTGREEDRPALVDAVLNQDGNLRERMTMFYNAALYNAGRGEPQVSRSVTLKRLFGEITDKEAKSNPALKGLDMKTIKSLQGGDVYSTARMSDIVGKKSLFSRISALKGFTSRVRRTTPKKSQPNGLTYQHYEEHGIGLSEREAAVAAPVVDGKRQDLSWREGGFFSKVDKKSKWIKERRAKGFQFITGPSGTTMRLLGSYKLLGATQEQLLAFRLALIAWMGSSQDHSLYEILYGSHLVGVKGKEDLSEAAKTYMTVDPLTPPQLRRLAGEGGEFPHERVFSAMLEELEQQRTAFADEHGENDEAHDFEMEKGLFPKDAADMLKTGQDKALNIYTTGAYQVMNQSMKYGKKIGWWLAARKLKNTYQKAKRRIEQGRSLDDMEGIEEIYNDATYEEVADDKMSSAIRSNIRIASAMSLEALRERSQYNSVGAERDQGHDRLAAEGGLGADYAKGVAYRGLGILRWLSDFKTGSTVTLSSLTSTSRSKGTAVSFYNKIKSKYLKPVLATYYLTNKSAVDISDTSLYGEDEVLLPRGAKFRVKTGLHLEDEMNQVELEEIAAPADRSNMVEENPAIAATITQETEDAGIEEQGGGTAAAPLNPGVTLDDREQQVILRALQIIDSDPDCIVTRNALEDLLPSCFTATEKIVAALNGQLSEQEKAEILRQARMVISQIDTGAYDFLIPMENIFKNHQSAIVAAL